MSWTQAPSAIEELTILNQDPLGTEPGSINYDPVKGTMNVRNAFTGSSIQVGQESVVFVINNTGSTISDGLVVQASSFDVANDAIEIILSLADNIPDAEVLGLTTTVILDGETGLVTTFGRVNDLDTTSFSAGEKVFLSDTVSGGLTNVRPAIPIQIGIVGKIDASTGFIQVDIRELQLSIYGSFSNSADQNFTANVTGVIEFDTDNEVSGITHSTTVNNDEFLFPNAGVYQATIEPQYTRSSGGGTDVMNVFIAKDTGSGFVNVPNTNVKFAVNDSGVTLVSPLTSTFRVDVGDIISFRIQVETALLMLEAFPTSGISPNDIPATPSVILNITQIGD